MLESSILNFDFLPTAQYIVVGALLDAFFVVLFLVTIIIIEKKTLNPENFKNISNSQLQGLALVAYKNAYDSVSSSFTFCSRANNFSSEVIRFFLPLTISATCITFLGERFNAW